MFKIKLTFSGDIMLNNSTINLYKTENEKYNFDTMFEGAKDFLKQADLAVGNLETPITKNKNEIKYKPYSFTSPIEFAEAVKNAGFKFVTTANNHCLDNGIDGIKKTIDALDEIKIDNTGISYGEDKIKLVEINGFKIAILSYTYGTNAFNNNVYLDKKDKNVKVNLFQNQELSNRFIRMLYNSNNVIAKIIKKIFRILGLFQFRKMKYERIEKSNKHKKEIIQKIQECKKSGADYTIMCMHEGGQYNMEPIKKAEKTARFLVKNGIDLVVGNHEHVVQCTRFYKDKLVAFSLGNFIGTAGTIEEPFDKMSEYSILLNIYLSKEKEKISINDYTFTILKSIKYERKDGTSVKVKLLYDLIQNCKNVSEKQKLLLDNKKIVKIVTGKNIDINDVKKEYKISKSVE